MDELCESKIKPFKKASKIEYHLKMLCYDLAKTLWILTTLKYMIFKLSDISKEK